MFVKHLNMLLVLTIAAGLTFTSTAVAAPKQDKELAAEVKEAIALFKKTDPSMDNFFSKSTGYTVFPKVAKGAAGIGAAKGTGELYEKGAAVGETKLTQVTVGFQLGGQVYSEVIFFEDEKSLKAFKEGKIKFSAQVSAVAAAAGASKNAKYENGIAIFTLAQGGLMYEASVGGQKFKYKAYKKK